LAFHEAAPVGQEMIDDEGGHDQHHAMSIVVDQGKRDNFLLNFKDVPPIWSEINKGTKVDYRHSNLTEILRTLSQNFNQVSMREQVNHFKDNETELLEMYRGEFETWELLRCLNLADKIYHTHKVLR